MVNISNLFILNIIYIKYFILRNKYVLEFVHIIISRIDICLFKGYSIVLFINYL